MANPMRRAAHLGTVRACARRGLQPADLEHVIKIVEALETLPALCQRMGMLGQQSVP
jgi:hypothetical protein